MAFSTSVYTDPGTYIQEVLVPGQINIAGQPLTLCLVGVGARNKTQRDEAVVRAFIEAEDFSADAGMSASPYQGTLQYHGDRSLSNTVVKRNGVTIADSQLSYPAATLTGTADLSGNIDMTVAGIGNNLGIEMDGNDAVTISLHDPLNLIHDRVDASTLSVGELFPGPIRGVLETATQIDFNFDAWTDGGGPIRTLTITGRDANGLVITEVITPGAGAYTGVKQTVAAFSRVSSIAAVEAGVTGDVDVGVAASNVAAQALYNTGGTATNANTDGTGSTLYVANTTVTESAMDMADVSTIINQALSAATLGGARGYGAAYSAVAAASGNFVALTSPVATPSSDIRLFAAITADATADAFGTMPQRAATVIQVADPSFVAGDTDWTVDYLADEDDEASGTGVSVTAGATVKLTSVGTPFAATDVGKYITVSGCTNAANNGRFQVLTLFSTASVTYTNASGVPETSGFAWSLEPRSDALANVAAELTRVGSFAGTDNFRANEDYVLTGGTVDWSYPDASSTAVITGTPTVSFDLATGAPDPDHTRLSIDGQVAFNMYLGSVPQIVAGGVGGLAETLPLGYNAAGTKTAVTAAIAAANINAWLANHPAYGPRRYASVASVSATRVALTSPTNGRGGSVTIMDPAGSTVASASTLVFGGTSSALGIGTRPSIGTTYFVSYGYLRPTSDYNIVRQHFSKDQALTEVGDVATDNPLAIATEIAFLNGAPNITTVQINNLTNQVGGGGDGTGNPTLIEVQDALAGAARSSTPTEMVLVGTAGTPLAHQVELFQHVEEQTGPLEKNYRRGWYGMDRGTQIGDKDTADTLLFRAGRTLKYTSNSPGRGRAVLMCPPDITGVTRTLRLPDDSIVTEHPLDSTYLAVACAAKFTSFISVAEALVRKTLRGFDLATVTSPLLKAERHRLASGGVTVVTLDAGRFILLDPITTERAAGAVIHFEQIQATGMKDNVTRKVDLALDNNIVGIVPSDLASFLIDIKLVIAAVLTGEISAGSIGPFRDENAAARPIDITTDIIVSQDATDPTKFAFGYYFNLRYPALRLFGQYSVDNPYFVSS